MPSLKLIHENNAVEVETHDQEIKMLEAEIQAHDGAVADRQLVVYAYHFTRLGHPLLAQKYLNRLTHDYFQVGVWKDLFQSMLAWSVINARPETKSEKFASAYEYYVLIKRVFESFHDLTFTTKPSFEKFQVEFELYSLFTNLA